MENNAPWEILSTDAVYAFARTVTNLAKSNPFDYSALDWIINILMTELWDNGFSQTEIRIAFERAIADMPRYAAGEEKRGKGWNA
ncbi:MAG: hypothetical protein PHU07_00695 [Acidocella sp.]|nr:hypothetical protein [Acidocella sp.]